MKKGDRLTLPAPKARLCLSYQLEKLAFLPTSTPPNVWLALPFKVFVGFAY
jgi:hypothetical protein